MKFLGKTIIRARTCGSSPVAGCPKHAFGLTLERGNELIAALHAHTPNCIGNGPDEVDYAKLMSGPHDLELHTAAEVFAVGFMLAEISAMIQNMVARPAVVGIPAGQPLPPEIQTLVDAAEASGVAVTVVRVDDPETPAPKGKKPPRWGSDGVALSPYTGDYPVTD